MGTTQKKTVSVDEIAKLQQLIDQVPPYVPTHVSKQKAITLLAPAIDTMRDKGYRWDDIATWLSDGGLAVSSAALRTYLRRIQAGTNRKTPRPQSNQRRAAISSDSSATVPRAIAAPASNERQNAAPNAPAVRLVALGAPTAVATGSTSGTSSRREPERSAFRIRPDTEDI
jgi:hypothetical protein